MSDKSPNSKKSSEQNEEKSKSSKIIKGTPATTGSATSGFFVVSVLLNAVLVGIVAYLAQKFYTNEKIFKDCTDYFRAGFRDDGVFEVWPSRASDRRFNVYCNMSAGGWTVIFKRGPNAKIDFQLPIEAYKVGFGDLNSDHFLGLDNINLLTRDVEREMTMVINSTSFKYKNFKVLNEYYHYKLVIENEIDRFIDGSSMVRLNNSLFSAIDVDFDLAVNSSCSAGWKAGWWFTDCFDHSLCLTCMIMHGNSGVKKLSYASMMIK